MATTTTITRRLPGGIREVTQTRSVNIVFVPFIRSRKIYFRVQGLLPNTKHKAFFDNTDVTTFCREETFVNISTVDNQPSSNEWSDITTHPDTASDLISDANGTIEGSFHLPNTTATRFRTGTREFKLRDFSATTDINATSKAFASYTAKGTLETIARTITTFLPEPPPPPIRRVDPVAQSFLIEKLEGGFVTSIDLFFKTKSSAVPVRCQIRAMENGLPTDRVLPGAEIFVNASDVNISAAPDVNTAATFTTFTFEAPVFLDGFKEYAIVVLAESDAYEVWTGVTKEFVVGSTTKRIMKQPAMGSFFKSQNGSTWTPDQSRDLMFKVKRAVFSTSVDGNAYFENTGVPVRRLVSSPIETTNASTTIRVRHPDHGLIAGDLVTLSGAVAVNGITAAQINVQQTVVDAADIDSYTVVTAGTATSSGFGGGTAVLAQENYQYNIAFPNINAMLLPGSNIAWTAKTTSGKSVAGSETAYQKTATYTAILPNDNNTFNTARLVASVENQTASLGGQRSMALKAVLTTDSTYLSPVIDLSRMSVNLIGNRIDRQAAAPATGFNVPANFVVETDAGNGSGIAKHIVRPVTLESPAEGIKILIAINRPSDSEFDTYYRTLPAGSDAALSEQAWIKATIDETIQTDDDPTIFRQYEYTVDIPTAPFTTFQLKFVMLSKNSANVPQAKDLRVIALST